MVKAMIKIQVIFPAEFVFPLDYGIIKWKLKRHFLKKNQ